MVIQPCRDLKYPDKDYGAIIAGGGGNNCELKLDFQVDPNNEDEGRKKQNAEKYNNNLHIWELGDFLKTVGKVVKQTTNIESQNKILAPQEIAALLIDKETKLPLNNGAVSIVMMPI